MLATAAYRGAWKGIYQRSFASFLSTHHSLPHKRVGDNDNEDIHRSCALYSTLSAAAPASSIASPNTTFPMTDRTRQIRTLLSSSSFSALPKEEEAAEKLRIETLTKYQKEMELRTLDSDLARLQTLRAINTGELYTLRGKFKMLSRDYGMGFLAWYWTVWFGTAGLSYAAIGLGGVDPMMVAAKIETFMSWEPMYLQNKLDPTLGEIGLVIAVNECLEPLRLPFVVVTTKPVVNFFTKRI